MVAFEKALSFVLSCRMLYQLLFENWFTFSYRFVKLLLLGFSLTLYFEETVSEIGWGANVTRLVEVSFLLLLAPIECADIELWSMVKITVFPICGEIADERWLSLWFAWPSREQWTEKWVTESWVSTRVRLVAFFLCTSSPHSLSPSVNVFFWSAVSDSLSLDTLCD